MARPGYVLTPDGHNQQVLMVTSSDGESWRIHREDADPEHRFLAYRLAATYFGNQNADKS